MAKSKSKTIYSCQNCGAQRARWEGKCSDCGSWNSFVEETLQSEPQTRGWATSKGHHKEGNIQVVSLDKDPEEIKMTRFQTGFTELDRVLGGGLAKGSFVLLGGSPGVGKSTLLLQMSGGLAKHKHRLLYISGEESVAQSSNRAHRLGVKDASIQIACESNLQTIIDTARALKPDVLVIDSIQTVYLPDLQAAPGSVSQVRECAGHLMGLAKQENMTVILVGHVTKDGNIAGPKVLEHMVDCVLSFDGDASYNFRLLRSLKNRFGPANELGVFQMSGGGLEEVLNPSELFLGERSENLVGSAVFAAIEGTRPLLCEVQSLTMSSPMPMPKRTSVGIDSNRIHLLTAVLDRHLDVHLGHHDIFINVVGGLKLNEPASDLAVAAAILSTEGRFELPAKTCFFGEIGLTGEVRAVSFADLRVKEADKLGFDHFVIPLNNKKHLADIKIPKEKKVTFIKNVQELSRALSRGGSAQHGNKHRN